MIPKTMQLHNKLHDKLHDMYNAVTSLTMDEIGHLSIDSVDIITSWS